MSNGVTVTGRNSSFDGSKSHLLIDLNADPKHFDVITLNGTALSLGSPDVVSEVVKLIPHKLLYKPRVEAYFYAAGDVSVQEQAGIYSKKYFPYASGGFVSDLLIVTADETNIIFTHTLDVGLGSYTSDADIRPIQCKYYVYSNEVQIPA